MRVTRRKSHKNKQDNVLIDNPSVCGSRDVTAGTLVDITSEEGVD
jgi:hypothetical protein